MKVKDILIRQKNNENIAISYKDTDISYKDLYDKAQTHCEIIKKIKTNRNVGIFMYNSIDYAVAYFSIAFADKVIIPIENNLKTDSFKSILKYCEVSLILSNDENICVLDALLKEIDCNVVVYNISTGEIIKYNSNNMIVQGEEDEEDVFIMLHTSGTTSDPKRVMLTNSNLISNIKSNILSLHLDKDDVCLIVLPMFFGYCNSSQFLSHLYVGAKLVIYDSIFTPKKFLKLIDKNKCTNTTCIPSMLFLVVNNVNRLDYDLSSLRFLCFGGGNMPVDMLKRIICFFDKTGIIQTYGQTEASPRVSCLLPEDTIRKIGSVGKAIPGVSINVFDNNDKPVGIGEIGQIVVKGPNVMKGYYKKEDITRETLKGGWLHTGDFGRFDDDGYLYIVGRMKNIIISGGLNIYPEEIEEALINHPMIKEVIVKGERNNILGEIPIAKVVLKNGCTCDENDLKKYLLSKFPQNKVPHKFIFCDELEKTFNGKLKRN